MAKVTDVGFADGSVRFLHETVSSAGPPRLADSKRFRGHQPGRLSGVQVALLFESLEICQHFVDRIDLLARDAAGVVELAQQLEIVEVLRRLELAPQSHRERFFAGLRAGPCGARSATSSALSPPLAVPPCRPRHDRADRWPCQRRAEARPARILHRTDGRRVPGERPASYGKEHRLRDDAWGFVSPIPAAIIASCTRRTDRDDRRAIGVGRRRTVRAWRLPVTDRPPSRDEGKSVAREPRNRTEGRLAGRDGPARRRPSAWPRRGHPGPPIQPVGRWLVPRWNKRSVQASGGLDGNLAAEPVGCGRYPIPAAVLILHHRCSSTTFYQQDARRVPRNGHNRSPGEQHQSPSGHNSGHSSYNWGPARRRPQRETLLRRKALSFNKLHVDSGIVSRIAMRKRRQED